VNCKHRVTLLLGVKPAGPCKLFHAIGLLWMLTDWIFLPRCIYLLAELSQLPDAAADVAKELPLVATTASFQHYTQHVHLLETMCKQVTWLQLTDNLFLNLLSLAPIVSGHFIMCLFVTFTMIQGQCQPTKTQFFNFLYYDLSRK